MAINVGKMVVGNNAVVETPQQPRASRSTAKNLSDIRRRVNKTDERLHDPKHLKLHEIDEEQKDKKVSQYMLDMYESNELISFDK